MSKNTYSEFFDSICRYDADGNRTSKTNALGTVYYKYDSENRLVSYGVTEAADTARLEYDADGNLIKESTPTKEAVYAYNAANRMAESHVTEIRGGSRQTPKDTVYSYDSFGRRILEADILNRWARHTEYRGLTMDVWKNAAVHGIKEPRDSRGIDSAGMVFTSIDDFLPAFADFSRASPYDFTHVALTLPLTAGGRTLGLRILQEPLLRAILAAWKSDSCRLAFRTLRSCAGAAMCTLTRRSSCTSLPAWARPFS